MNVLGLDAAYYCRWPEFHQNGTLENWHQVSTDSMSCEFFTDSKLPGPTSHPVQNDDDDDDDDDD